MALHRASILAAWVFNTWLWFGFNAYNDKYIAATGDHISMFATIIKEESINTWWALFLVLLTGLFVHAIANWVTDPGNAKENDK